MARLFIDKPDGRAVLRVEWTGDAYDGKAKVTGDAAQSFNAVLREGSASCMTKRGISSDPRWYEVVRHAVYSMALDLTIETGEQHEASLVGPEPELDDSPLNPNVVY